MGGNNKGKGAKSKRKSAGDDVPTQTGQIKAKKAKTAEQPAQQPLLQHSKSNSKAKNAQVVATDTQIQGELEENGADRTIDSSQEVDCGNNNAIPESDRSRSRPHSQESQRQKLRDLRDSLKEKALNKGKPNYGDGGEGCSYQEAPAQIQVIDGRRVLRSNLNSTKETNDVVHNTGNISDKVVQAKKTTDRTEFSKNNARKVGQTAKIIAERTKFTDESHGRDPDGVSLDVSDDDYREENYNSDNDNFSEVSSQDEGADSDSGQDQSEVDERPPAQSSSESEDEVTSSSSSSSEEENDKIRKKFRKDPNYKKVLESLVAEEMRKKKEKRKKRRRERKEKRERRRKRERGKFVMRSNVTPQRTTIRSNVTTVTPHRIPTKYLSPIVKSPSDSTLYTPALKLLKQQGNTVLKGQVNNASTIRNADRVLNGPSNESDSEEVIEKISNFVDNMRIESSRKSNKRDRRRSHSRYSDDQSQSPPRRQDREDVAREVTDRIILESEKFKAQLVAPKGMPSRIDSNIELLRKLDNDDDFFHTSCHIETTLKLKIEQGEFVDLDKLLPIDKGAGGVSMAQDNRLGLVYEDGEAFLAPAKKVNKINSFRKWDTAFRVYSTIYSEANPHRASELLQYVQVIHLAASNNPWDNVAFYDFTFRQLMASKPWRSWAKTYTQGWNLAFTNTSKPFSNGNANSNGSSSSSNNYKGGRGSKGNGNWKDDCCWKYNKNQCSRSSTECKWNHRCTFCAGWNHSKANCRKRQKSGGSPATTAVTKPEQKK